MIALAFKLIAAIAPALALAIIINRRDRLRPEPTSWLFGAAALGVAAALGAIIIGFIIDDPGEVYSFGTALYTSFVSAAIPEEALKLGMLCILASCCRHFDEYFDGIVYAVCIGMGFAAFENILYLFGEDDWLIIGISRALLAVPAHYFFAVIMGAFFALSYFHQKNRTLYRCLALIIPIAVHGLYDFFCFYLPISDGLSMAILLAFFVFFKWIRRYARRLMQSMLTLDAGEQSPL